MSRRVKPKRLSVKQLESYLQDSDDFNEPKVNLEQYATPVHIASVMLNYIDESYDDLRDKFVADLGCGTGRLTLGSLLCDAKMVFGFDIDSDALRVAMNNINDLFDDNDSKEYGCCSDSIDLTRELENDIAKLTTSESLANVYRACDRFNFVQTDISRNDLFWTNFGEKFDTVIMNPPFGTKLDKGLDMVFLERALQISSNVVYSLHKTSTRDYIFRYLKKSDVDGKPIAKILYNLEKTYKFHKRNSVDIEVDLWRISKRKLES